MVAVPKPFPTGTIRRVRAPPAPVKDMAETGTSVVFDAAAVTTRSSRGVSGSPTETATSSDPSSVTDWAPMDAIVGGSGMVTVSA